MSRYEGEASIRRVLITADGSALLDIRPDGFGWRWSHVPSDRAREALACGLAAIAGGWKLYLSLPDDPDSNQLEHIGLSKTRDYPRPDGHLVSARNVAVGRLLNGALELWFSDGAGGLFTTSQTGPHADAGWVPRRNFLAEGNGNPGALNAGARDMAVAVLPDRRLELWVADGAGGLFTTWQTSPDSGTDWVAWWNFLAEGNGNPGPLPAGARNIAVGLLPDGVLELWVSDGAGGLFTTWQTSPDNDASWVPWWDFLAEGNGNPGPLPAGARDVTVGRLPNGVLELWVSDGAGGLYTTWKTSPSPDADWVPWWNFLADGNGNPGPLPAGARNLTVGTLPNGVLELWVSDGAGGLYTTWKTSPSPDADWVPWWNFLADGNGNPGPLPAGARDVAVAALQDWRLELWAGDGEGGLFTTRKADPSPGADWTPWTEFLT